MVEKAGTLTIQLGAPGESIVDCLPACEYWHFSQCHDAEKLQYVISQRGCPEQGSRGMLRRRRGWSKKHWMSLTSLWRKIGYVKIMLPDAIHMERCHSWQVRGTALPSVVSYFLDKHEERGALQEDYEDDIKAVGGVIFQGKHYSFSGLRKNYLLIPVTQLDSRRYTFEIHRASNHAYFIARQGLSFTHSYLQCYNILGW